MNIIIISSYPSNVPSGLWKVCQEMTLTGCWLVTRLLLDWWQTLVQAGPGPGPATVWRPSETPQLGRVEQHAAADAVTSF